MFRELLTRTTAAAKGAGMVVVRRIREAIKPRSALGGLIADLTRTWGNVVDVGQAPFRQARRLALERDVHVRDGHAGVAGLPDCQPEELRQQLEYCLGPGRPEETFPPERVSD